MRLFLFVGLAALVTGGSAFAVTDPTTDPVAAGTLPPITEPPIDVPMHVPQPPREPNAPAAPRAAPPAPAPAVQALPQPTPAPATPKRILTAQMPADTITPRNCREAAYNVIIDSRHEVAFARFCQMTNGAWRLTP